MQAQKILCYLMFPNTNEVCLMPKIITATRQLN